MGFREERNPCFFRGFPCFFQKKQGVEGQGPSQNHFTSMSCQQGWTGIVGTEDEQMGDNLTALELGAGRTVQDHSECSSEGLDLPQHPPPVSRAKKAHKHKETPCKSPSYDPTLKILYVGVLLREKEGEEVPPT